MVITVYNQAIFIKMTVCKIDFGEKIFFSLYKTLYYEAILLKIYM